MAGRGKEKFSNAVYALATGREVIQERLIGAFRYNISSLQPNDVPDDMVEELLDLQTGMTRVQNALPNGIIAATARTLSDDKAVEIAQRVLAFNYNLRD